MNRLYENKCAVIKYYATSYPKCDTRIRRHQSLQVFYFANKIVINNNILKVFEKDTSVKIHVAIVGVRNTNVALIIVVDVRHQSHRTWSVLRVNVYDIIPCHIWTICSYLKHCDEQEYQFVIYICHLCRSYISWFTWLLILSPLSGYDT